MKYLLIIIAIAAMPYFSVAQCQFDEDITLMDTIQLDSLFRDVQMKLLKYQQLNMTCTGDCFAQEMQCCELKLNTILKRRKECLITGE